MLTIKHHPHRSCCRVAITWLKTWRWQEQLQKKDLVYRSLMSKKYHSSGQYNFLSVHPSHGVVMGNSIILIWMIKGIENTPTASWIALTEVSTQFFFLPRVNRGRSTVVDYHALQSICHSLILGQYQNPIHHPWAPIMKEPPSYSTHLIYSVTSLLSHFLPLCVAPFAKFEAFPFLI